MHVSKETRRFSSKLLWIHTLSVLALTGALLSGFISNGVGAATAPDGGASSKPLDAATLASVQSTVLQFKDTNHTPGVLVGIWSPRGTFVSATGVADLSTGAPLTTDAQFKIASQTKAFTADLILQLIGEGKVSFDDHISKWVAGVPNGNQITIRELLNMTSGLQTGFLVEEANVNKLATGCTEADVLAAGAAQAPLSPPGTKWSYSNYGYDLLGRVVELVTGENISTAIQQRIARPLGLHRTFLPTSGNGLSVPFTHGYGTGGVLSTQAPGVASDDATALHQSCVGASGGMVSTLSDLRVWSRALGTGALLKPAVWKEAQKDMIPYAFTDNYNGPGRWYQGLGFVESGGFIGKEGSFPGYESITMYSPSRHTTIEVVSTKQPDAITPTRMFQALAMDVYGPNIGFGLTPAQAIAPTYTGMPAQD
jgi:D-alanyl-D-alanine carboxypeptidase